MTRMHLVSFMSFDFWYTEHESTRHERFARSSHKTRKVDLGTFVLKPQKLVCNRLTLPDICRRYIDIIERQLEVPDLPSTSRVLLMHQVLVWELIKGLFSSRKLSGELKPVEDEEDDMIPAGRESYPDVDEEALPLIRRAEFSFWLQESVYHHVQEEVSSKDEFSDLEHMFLLLTGRLAAAVELATSKGDVRLSCLLSLAGGSTENRADVAQQLDLWRKNGLDFSFIEEDRVRLLELLAGNIHGALRGVKIDWKRFLGMLMWYQLPPDISLPVVFNTYQKLLNEGNAPYPVPVYIDEGPIEVASSLLLCLGQCHWAIYVVLHMPHRDDYPYLQTNVIREILLQHCEVWSTQDPQWEFIENLGIPSAWLHEALSKHSEIWRLATAMEDYKSEIEDWDLRAGLYISFFLLRSSFQEDSNTMTELDTLENKNDACADFIARLNNSWAVWAADYLLMQVVYSKMAEEISSLLLSDSGEGSSGEVQLRCFETVFKSPVPEDLRSYHLQDAVSLFATCLSETAQ
ncbi:hypothetical protein OROGR_029033 [Orobanche gracilis]